MRSFLARCTLVVVAAGCATPPPRAPAAPAPSFALPRAAAVIAQEEDGVRLYVADFASGKLQPIGPASELPHQPVWSPDGTRLAWRIGKQLWMHTEDGRPGAGAAPDAVLVDGIEIETQRPCAFSGDGQHLAIAGAGGAVLLGDERAVPRPVLRRAGMTVGDLAWSPDGRTLTVLFTTAGRGEIAHITIADGSVRSERDDAASRFLGFRPDGGLLVLDAAEGRQRVGLVGPAGFSPLQSLPEEHSVVDYAAGADRLLIAGHGEDTGDDAVVSLAPPDGATPARRWLASHPQLADVHLTRDGQAALFVDRGVGSDGRPGGSVFLATIGSDAAELVLRATSERSFSEPTPRPSTHR